MNKVFTPRARRKRMARHSQKKEAEPAPGVTFLQLAGKAARGADRVLTALVAAVLALVLFYACFALWDTWRIYDRAGVDDSLLRYKPQLNGAGEGDGFEELRAINPDVCAWLTVEDTHIDYPVVQGTDNAVYVNTNVYGEFSLSGSIFLDYRNARDFTDTYSLIYGHHMDGEVMFGELEEFAQQEYFEEHVGGILYLPENTCQIEWFACLKTDAYDQQIFSPGSLSQKDQEVLLEHIRENALQYRDIGVTGEERILALSTCSDTSTNGRMILVGRLCETKDYEGSEG